MMRRFTLRSRTEAMRKREASAAKWRAHHAEVRILSGELPVSLKREDRTLFMKMDAKSPWIPVNDIVHEQLVRHGVIPKIDVVETNYHKLFNPDRIVRQITSPNWLLWSDIAHNTSELQQFLSSITPIPFRNRVIYELQKQLELHNQKKTVDIDLTILR